MNIKRLETFVWVATLGSFRKAADRLYSTQPAISSRIQGLEEELGVKLFERFGGPGPVVLTPKGKELLPYAEKILHMADQLKQRANLNHSFSGVLRLGVSETIVHTWLSDFLGRLSTDIPNIEVEMTVDVTGNLKNGLLDSSLDLAFLLGPVTEPTIANLALTTFPLVWTASPKLGLPATQCSLADLAQWPIITYARTTRPYMEIKRRFRELDTLPVRYFTSSSLASCRRLTLDGVGVSTLPEAMIQQELADGELQVLDLEWIPSALAFTASYAITPSSPIAEVAAELAVEVSSAYSIKKFY